MYPHSIFKRPNHTTGFSIYKMLIVIILIGIVVVGVMRIKDLDARSRAAKNAMIILSTYEAAAVAGAFQSTGEFSRMSTKREILDAIHAGVSGVGIFSDTVFKFNKLDAQSRAEAEAFLEYDSEAGVLGFDPNAVLPY